MSRSSRLVFGIPLLGSFCLCTALCSGMRPDEDGPEQPQSTKGFPKPDSALKITRSRVMILHDLLESLRAQMHLKAQVQLPASCRSQSPSAVFSSQIETSAVYVFGANGFLGIPEYRVVSGINAYAIHSGPSLE